MKFQSLKNQQYKYKGNKLSNTNFRVESFEYFSSAVYKTSMPQFIDDVKLVADESIERNKDNVKMDELYPVCMSENIVNDPRVFDFSKVVAQLGWDILNSQGYQMDNIEINYGEMWMQEHYKTSGMEQHVHGNGCQLTGFYFLEVPENSSRLVFHDARAGKVQIDLPEKDVSAVTLASQKINFIPEVGMLYVSNSWLPHSFTKHGSDEPIKFVHINLYARTVANPTCGTKAEII